MRSTKHNYFAFPPIVLQKNPCSQSLNSGDLGLKFCALRFTSGADSSGTRYGEGRGSACV